MKTFNFKNNFLLLPLLVLGLTFASCQKSTVGPAGVDGVNGVDGAQGPAGTPGNANVKSLTFSVTNWKADSICKLFSFKYHTADLSNKVLESGAIMLYIGDSSGDNNTLWKSMPLLENEVRYTFNIELSTIEIVLKQPNGMMPKNPGAQKFKLVIIPPAA